ncbi:hypothetical protein BC828DRAFT_388442 [Blastocladiella britannica]|nr:hypothetical protein BC828DRAFT_388442 [Blastocladiella britannica]
MRDEKSVLGFPTKGPWPVLPPCQSAQKKQKKISIKNKMPSVRSLPLSLLATAMVILSAAAAADAQVWSNNNGLADIEAPPAPPAPVATPDPDAVAGSVMLWGTAKNAGVGLQADTHGADNSVKAAASQFTAAGGNAAKGGDQVEAASVSGASSSFQVSQGVVMTSAVLGMAVSFL